MPVLNTKMSFSDLNYAFYAISQHKSRNSGGKKKKKSSSAYEVHKLTKEQLHNLNKEKNSEFHQQRRPPDSSFLKKHCFVSYLRKNRKRATITGNTHAHSGKRKQNI